MEGRFINSYQPKNSVNLSEKIYVCLQYALYIFGLNFIAKKVDINFINSIEKISNTNEHSKTLMLLMKILLIGACTINSKTVIKFECSN